MFVYTHTYMGEECLNDFCNFSVFTITFPPSAPEKHSTIHRTVSLHSVNVLVMIFPCGWCIRVPFVLFIPPDLQARNVTAGRVLGDPLI